MKKDTPKGVSFLRRNRRSSSKFHFLIPKEKQHTIKCAVLAEKERFALRALLQHQFNFAVLTTAHFIVLLPLKIAPSLVHRTRSQFFPLLPEPALEFEISLFNTKRKTAHHKVCCPGGEREIRTLAPVTRPTPLAGAPLRPT